MIQKIKKEILMSLFILATPLLTTFAATPTLTVSPTGDGHNVSVTITNADGNVPVVLFFSSSLYTGTQSRSIGSTGNNGTFSGIVSTSAYGITATSPVYALVNGYQTSNVTWPYSTTVPTSTNVISFSDSNPTIIPGQSSRITITGSLGTYYIASNNNQSAVQATLSGNILTMYGIKEGSAAIVICATTNVCSTEIVTVRANTVPSGAPTVSQNTVTVGVGQTTQVLASSGIAPYSVFYDGTNIVQAVANGSIISLQGITLGTSSVSVCSKTGGCTPVQVTVTSTSPPTTASNIMFTIPVSVGQSIIIPLSGGTGSYYIPTPMSTPARALLSGTYLYITGVTTGKSSISVCSSSSACSSLSFSVSETTTQITTPNVSNTYEFKSFLTSGMNTNEVLKLQELLVEKGYLHAIPNGNYGPATTASVKAFQRDRNISPVGYVGPSTRAALNNE